MTKYRIIKDMRLDKIYKYKSQYLAYDFFWNLIDIHMTKLGARMAIKRAMRREKVKPVVIETFESEGD